MVPPLRQFIFLNWSTILVAKYSIFVGQNCVHRDCGNSYGVCRIALQVVRHAWVVVADAIEDVPQSLVVPVVRGERVYRLVEAMR